MRPTLRSSLAPLKKVVHRLFAVDPRALGLLRLALGAITLVHVGTLAASLTTFYSDVGVLPPSDLLAVRPDRLSLHLLSGDTRVLSALFAVHLLAAALLFLGYRTRLATFVTWLLTISLQLRNPLLNDGADALLAMMLLWGNFVPWGECLSLDVHLRRVTRRTAPVLSLGALAILLQMPLVYVVTAMQKNGPMWRSDFDAVYFALNNDFIASRLGVLLGSAPLPLLKGLAIFTLAAEASIPFLLFFPGKSQAPRLVGLGLGLALQVGFFTCFDVGIFPFVSTAALLGFLPSTLLSRLRVPRGDAAASFASSRSYRWSEALCAAFLGLVVLSSLSTLGLIGVRPEVSKTISALRLSQGWRMFVQPAKNTGYYVLEGKLADGQKVDVLHHDLSRVHWEKPDHVSSSFATRNLRKYFSVIRSDEAKPYRAAFATYLCNAWNADESSPHLAAIRLHFRSVAIGAAANAPVDDAIVLRKGCAAAPKAAPRGEALVVSLAAD